MDQRREDLDVGAHDDDVARLERRVVGEQVEDRVAHDLDLAGAAVAGVHLQASIVRLQQHALVVGAGEGQARRGAVGANVGLDSAEQRRPPLLDD